MGPHEADIVGRAGAWLWRAASSMATSSVSSISQPGAPEQRRRNLPEPTVGVGVGKLRCLRDNATGFRSHGVQYLRHGSRGAINQGIGHLATGIRDDALAVYLRICTSTCWTTEMGGMVQLIETFGRRAATYRSCPHHPLSAEWCHDIRRGVAASVRT